MKRALKVSIFALALSLLPSITGYEPAKAALVTSGLELNLDASVAGSYNGTTWFDQSGSGINATQVNSPTYNASDGSFTFNGTNQYFNLGNVKAKTGAFTLEVTFSPNSVSGSPALVARQNTGVAGNYFVGISNSKVNHYVESSPWGVNGNSTLTTNTKYVATMVYDSSKNITPYLNGTLNGTATNFAGTLYNNTINLQIGAALNSSSASDFFSGKIYSVRMYSRALTATEIDQNYRATSNYILSTASAASSCTFPTSNPYGWLLQAGSSSTITKVRMQYSNAATNSSFFANRMEFYADNNGVMGSSIGTLTPETITAASTLAGAYGSTRMGEYVGRIQVTSGSRFWMKTSANGSSISACMSGGYITKSSGWAPVLNGSNFVLYNGAYISYSGVFIYEMLITDENMNPTIATPSTSGSVSKGIVTTISVTSDASGTVRFFLNGKRIPGCFSRATTGSSPTYTATCSWRPTTQGQQRITAQLVTAVQGASSPTSAPLTVFVGRRTTLR
jgi:hypothetical protein